MSVFVETHTLHSPLMCLLDVDLGPALTKMYYNLLPENRKVTKGPASVHEQLKKRLFSLAFSFYNILYDPFAIGVYAALLERNDTLVFRFFRQLLFQVRRCCLHVLMHSLLDSHASVGVGQGVCCEWTIVR